MKQWTKINSALLSFCILFSNCHNGAAIIAEKAKKPLNIILLIGDGMGLAQISAAAVLNGGLSLDLFTNIGLIKTSSSDDYITDSAAGATAYSCGIKTFNGAIGVGPDSMALLSILELAEKNGLSTGLVATCSITHATPAAFYGHQINREMHREIANDFYNKGIDYMAAGGKPYFDMDKLKIADYIVHTGKSSNGHMIHKNYAWFYSDSIDLPKSDERGTWLKDATVLGLQHVSANKKGFFMMVEGSQIDWGGHDNDFNYMAKELIDFDKAVKAALDFAMKDGNTLVIVTADHETGGLSLNGGNLKNKTIVSNYATTHHSGIMVPIYAYGPGSENFRGTFENTEVFRQMKRLFGF